MLSRVFPKQQQKNIHNLQFASPGGGLHIIMRLTCVQISVKTYQASTKELVLNQNIIIVLNRTWTPECQCQRLLSGLGSTQCGPSAPAVTR